MKTKAVTPSSPRASMLAAPCIQYCDSVARSWRKYHERPNISSGARTTACATIGVSLLSYTPVFFTQLGTWDTALRVRTTSSITHAAYAVTSGERVTFSSPSRFRSTRTLRLLTIKKGKNYDFCDGDFSASSFNQYLSHTRPCLSTSFPQCNQSKVAIHTSLVYK